VIAVVAPAAVLVVWGAASGRLARYSVTMPILLVGIGALLAAGSKPLLTLDPSGEIVHELLELTLAVLLFVDATEVSAGWLRESARYPLRLLGMGFPLTVAAGLAVARCCSRTPTCGSWRCSPRRSPRPTLPLLPR